MKRLLDYNSLTGVAEYFHSDPSDNGFHIQTVQDVRPILEQNKNLRNHGDKGWKGDMVHYASIPIVVLEKWWKELGSDPLAKENRKWLQKKLNDPDWKHLRTKEGRL